MTLIVPDTNAITLKFRAGETDVTTIQHTDYPSFKREEKKRRLHDLRLGANQHHQLRFAFNQNPRSSVAKSQPWLIKTFRDARFRQAVAFAINRQRIMDQVFLGLAQPLYGPETPWNKQFYNPKVAQYPYDPDKAKALLKDNGLERQ